MSFENLLNKIVEPCASTLGAALMGSDGIPIAHVPGPGAPASAEEDVSVLSVELGRILSECQKLADSTESGVPEEFTLQLERVGAVVRRVDDENYLVVAFAPGANVGRVRFGMRRYLFELQELL
ncbi:MAG: hypothetical protein GY937_16540 [bacterium]|nr:hypothetical protein [bacterium]